MTEQLRDEVAASTYAIERNKILAKIERGECSASMSGIEYYPKWDDAPEALKASYLEKATVAIAIVLERAADAIKADKDWGDYDFGPGFDQAVKIIEALQEQNKESR